MFNHNRGLWGYTGRVPDGTTLTIQSSGMGGPSAAIVVSELAQLGARTIVRVGTCGALHHSLELGDLLLVGQAVVGDGTSRALGACDRVEADSELLGAFARAGAPAAQTVVSSDLFYDHDSGRERAWRAAGAVAVEMECATIFVLARRLGVTAAAVLVVSDLLRPRRVRIAREALSAAERCMGDLTLRALAQTSAGSR